MYTVFHIARIGLGFSFDFIQSDYIWADVDKPISYLSMGHQVVTIGQAYPTGQIQDRIPDEFLQDHQVVSP